jgi:predicted enzyme related to lactoylglutathione lyase
MHRILMRTVVLDFAPDAHDDASEFWRVALAGGMHRNQKYPEYHVLEHGAAVGPVLVQCLGQGPSRVHLDIETDDIEAEVERLRHAGATVVQRYGEGPDEWTVLQDPAGLLFCVVPADSKGFDELARTVS